MTNIAQFKTPALPTYAIDLLAAARNVIYAPSGTTDARKKELENAIIEFETRMPTDSNGYIKERQT